MDAAEKCPVCDHEWKWHGTTLSLEHLEVFVSTYEGCRVAVGPSGDGNCGDPWLRCGCREKPPEKK